MKKYEKGWYTVDISTVHTPLHKDTIYFLRSFFFSDDWERYTKTIEEMCEKDVQIFKTDSKAEHLSSSEIWREKYVTFLGIDDVEN